MELGNFQKPVDSDEIKKMASEDAKFIILLDL